MRAQKKAIFWSKFSKMPKNTFFGLFGLLRRKFGQYEVFLALCESSEFHLVDMKKGRQNFLKFSENPPPPENLGSATAWEGCSLLLLVGWALSGLEFIVPTFDKKVTEYLCSGWVFFFQTNFDFLTSHF